MNIGQIAPHIELYDTERQKVKLSDFANQKIVLFFFPAAWTGMCIKEMCTVRDDMSYYHDLKAIVIGISVDTPFALKKFKLDQNLPFVLLSDFNKTVIRAYGVYREDFILDMHGVADRSIYIIGSDGTIQYKEVLENPSELPDFAAAKRALETIQ